ncbi:MAG TPA: tetratricopeptide repeat protein [Fimbriimonadaceae bacterium]|nr:tetratricopeptide repeat protein [Fimbriimonadaceae bacterium]HRJ34033.1 tetratricopeptide repeat protein [Fimbriimonadaceae bacterium]
MNPQDLKIAELFDLGADAESAEATTAVGVDAEESRELGQAALQDGDFETALQHFQRAIDEQGLDPATVSLEMAASHEAMGRSAQALRLYRRARRAHDDAQIQVAVAEIYRREGRTRKAIEELRLAIEAQPAASFLHYKMAEACRNLKLYQGAYAAIQNAIVFAPDDPFYHYWQTDLLVEMGLFPAAIESARSAIELSPGDDHLYLLASIAFWGDGKLDQAIKAARLASDLNPDRHLYHGLLYRLLRADGKELEADQELVRAKKMDRYDLDYLGRLLALIPSAS